MNNQLKQNKPLFTPQQKGDLFILSIWSAFFIAWIVLSFVFIHSYGG
jgi:hypothetical protein